MHGKRKVCVELNRPVPKDFNTHGIIYITGNEMKGFYQVKNTKKNGSNITFLMPNFSCPQMERGIVNINIEYKQEVFHQSQYVYIRKLDGMYL
jgi:hypothetical protein